MIFFRYAKNWDATRVGRFALSLYSIVLVNIMQIGLRQSTTGKLYSIAFEVILGEGAE